MCHVYAKLPMCTSSLHSVYLRLEQLSIPIMCIMSVDNICFSHTFHILIWNESWMIKQVLNCIPSIIPRVCITLIMHPCVNYNDTMIWCWFNICTDFLTLAETNTKWKGMSSWWIPKNFWKMSSICKFHTLIQHILLFCITFF